MAAPKPTVLVVTGNSHTGEAVITALREKYAGQVKIRVVVRKEKNGERLKGVPDVEIVQADLLQKSLLAAIFKDDINAAFLATPCAKNRVAVAQAFIDACIEFGVDFPVIVSLVGATTKAKDQGIKEMGEVEAYALAKAGTPVKRQMWDKGKQVLQPVLLRCGQFFQNSFGYVTMIKAKRLYLPLGDEGRVPHTDLQDIGAAVANILVNPAPFGGRTLNLIAEYQTGGQMASSINMGASAGCNYEQVSDDVALAGFQAGGISAYVAEHNVSVMRFYRSGGGQGEGSDLAEALGAGHKVRKYADFCKRALKPLL